MAKQTATARLIKSIETYGKKTMGPIQEKKGQKYQFIDYQLFKPTVINILQFKQATKENKGDYKHFNNNISGDGWRSFSCDFSKFKGGTVGTMQMQVLRFVK